ncbi:monomeric [FeFe] hydrogenase [Haliovirga abyssi]|uniref:[Fe] hydrogenase n=1 Tax=Haliovirga abyssi TaxID=2996794 RepID=A0AAU9DR57_9FUSO|nr:monomeric [FeFe] hydrogenase [Haliovirga abyssi]BDU51028.1 [Fe] hydrogenase [Haliovirga abyssi]
MRNFILNEKIKLRRKTLIELARATINNNLKKELPKLSKKILPGNEAKYRESIYQEREILNQRIKIYLGMDYEKSKDMEMYEVAENIDEILEKNSKYSNSSKILQIIEEACDVCPSNKYYVTDLCRNCIEHSCKSVCPKNAITIENSKAKIDLDKCIGCGLCARACSYYSIVKLERPCENSCELKAITKNPNGTPKIEEEKCVNCGSCYIACPFGAIESKLDLIKVLNRIKKDNKRSVIAIFAPSVAGQFGPKVTIGQIKNGLKRAGFNKAYEVALGADMVAEEESEYIENSNELVTTSCCPAFVDYIKKHQKDYIKNISPSDSPMIALAKKIKEEEDCEIVFIGPCIAKKNEDINREIVDYVITFEELGALFISCGVEPAEIEDVDYEGSFDGWNFAHSGGVAQAVINKLEGKEISCIKMDGLKESKELFSKLKNEKFDLMEGMACEGGCICGPGIMVNPNVANAVLKKIKK